MFAKLRTTLNYKILKLTNNPGSHLLIELESRKNYQTSMNSWKNSCMHIARAAWISCKANGKIKFEWGKNCTEINPKECVLWFTIKCQRDTVSPLALPLFDGQSIFHRDSMHDGVYGTQHCDNDVKWWNTINTFFLAVPITSIIQRELSQVWIHLNQDSRYHIFLLSLVFNEWTWIYFTNIVFITYVNSRKQKKLG